MLDCESLEPILCDRGWSLIRSWKTHWLFSFGTKDICVCLQHGVGLRRFIMRFRTGFDPKMPNKAHLRITPDFAAQLLHVTSEIERVRVIAGPETFEGGG